MTSSVCMKKVFSVISIISSVILLLLGVSPFFSPFNKTFAQEKIYILSDTSKVVKSVSNIKMSDCSVNMTRSQLLKEMRECGEILTSSEFASRITSYYDTLVGTLGIMFVVFTLVTYFPMKQAFEGKFDNKEREIDEKQQKIKGELKDEVRKVVIDQLRDSRFVRDDIVRAVMGSIDGQFALREDFEKLDKSIQDISNVLADVMRAVGNIQDGYALKLSVSDEQPNEENDKEIK